MANRPAAPSRPEQRKTAPLWETGLASLRAFNDTITMGAWPAASAAIYAAFSPSEKRTFAQRYSKYLEAEKSYRGYDQQNHPYARAYGAELGAAASILLTHKLAGRLAPVVIPETEVTLGRLASPPTASDRIVVAGAAGVANVGFKAATNLAENKASTKGDYIAAAVGGGVDGAVSPYLGPVIGGAVGGGAQSLVEDVANREPISLPKAGMQVAGGAYFGGLGQVAGEQISNRLLPGDKGDLGEAMSIAKTISRGDLPIKIKKYMKLEGRSRGTYVDQITLGNKWIEAKFGPKARLSPAQTWAKSDPTKDYRVDYWLPEDVGLAAGIALSAPEKSEPFNRERK